MAACPCSLAIPQNGANNSAISAIYNIMTSKVSLFALLGLGLLATYAHAVTEDPNAPEPPPPGHWTPLDHLAFDPRGTSLPQGFSKGKTDGTAPYIGHRFIDDVGGSGWGWIKSSSNKSWGSTAKWCALKETPGVIIAPNRSFTKPDGDLNYEYEIWGYWAKYTAYDPRTDERLPVFVLQGWRVIGPSPALALHVGLPGRQVRRDAGPSSRTTSPIRTDPGID